MDLFLCNYMESHLCADYEILALVINFARNKQTSQSANLFYVYLRTYIGRLIVENMS